MHQRSLIAREAYGQPLAVGPPGAFLLEQNDEWAVQRSRVITLESISPVSDDPLVGLPAVAA